MRKVYFLSTCSTSKRIINELDLRSKDFEFQDIKSESITENQLSEMHELAGSYEVLFSRIARKYKELGLKDKNLTENEFKNFILTEYTFLKRPVVIIDQQMFIGSGKANIQNLMNAL
jgi:arsenate reductase